MLSFLDLDIVRPISYSSSYHCVYKKDGYNFDRNCYTSSHYFKCDGKGKSLYFTK